MKHSFSDAQIIEASQKAGTAAGLQYATLSIDYLHAFANALPDPDNEWQQCTFGDIRKGDRIRRVQVYDSGTTATFEGIVGEIDKNYIWDTSLRIFLGEKSDLDNNGITLYRIPAPVQHPDPDVDRIILVHEYRVAGNTLSCEPTPFISDGEEGVYFGFDRTLLAEEITSFTPAKVVAQDDR